MDLTPTQKAKKRNGLCISHCCPNQRRGNYCSKCSKRQYAKRHPIRNAFYNLRTNAKRRGKVFTLTLEQFREFAVSTEYIDKRGKTAESFSIDRIDNSRGYEADNIRVLTLSENSTKRNQEDYSDVPF